MHSINQSINYDHHKSNIINRKLSIFKFTSGLCCCCCCCRKKRSSFSSSSSSLGLTDTFDRKSNVRKESNGLLITRTKRTRKQITKTTNEEKAKTQKIEETFWEGGKMKNEEN